MSNSIPDLFDTLERTGSLEATLRQVVRSLCEAGACNGGAVVMRGPGGTAQIEFPYDPTGLLDSFQESGSSPPRTTSASARWNEASFCQQAGMQEVRIPLWLEGQAVAGLYFVAANDDAAARVTTQAEPLKTALAVLLAAQRNLTNPPFGIVDANAFRRRLAAEIDAARRNGGVFSVMRVRIGEMEDGGEKRDDDCGACLEVLADHLRARLRTSDLIGLIDARQLAILMPGTGRLGARIAARRIEQMGQRSANHQPTGDDDWPRPIVCEPQTFPHDVDRLIGWSESPQATAGTVRHAEVAGSVG